MVAGRRTINEQRPHTCAWRLFHRLTMEEPLRNKEELWEAVD
jgi:hypothetical protein